MVEGSIKGIKMRFIDTPGLLLSPNKVGHNAGILAQVSFRLYPVRSLLRLMCQQHVYTRHQCILP